MIPLLNANNPAREVPQNTGFMGYVNELGNSILYGIFSRFSPPPTTFEEDWIARMTPEERADWDRRMEANRRAQEADTQRRFTAFVERERGLAEIRERAYEANLAIEKENMGMTPESARGGGWFFQQRLAEQDPLYLDIQRWSLDPRWEDPEFRKIQAQRYMDGEFNILNTWPGNITPEGGATSRYCQQEMDDIYIQKLPEMIRQKSEILHQLQRVPDEAPHFRAKHKERFESQSIWERLKKTTTAMASSRTVQVTAALGMTSILFFSASQK